MRIHSNTLTTANFYGALRIEKDAGRIARHVYFKTLTEHGSKSHGAAFEIGLEAIHRDRGRRAGNSGSYGAMDDGSFAATYDEWGWLLSALFEIDPAMLCGSPRYPAYRDRDDFDEKTGLSYRPAALLESLRVDGDPFPYVSGRGSKSKLGSVIGRRGAQRISEADGRGRIWAVYKPRTIEFVEALAAGEVF